MTRKQKVLAACFASALAIALLAGCDKRAAAVAQSSSPARNPLEIAVRPDLMRDLRIGQAEWTSVSGTLDVAAHVEADERRMARINAPVAGRIVELEVVEGQQVTRGQVLATLHSTELAAAQSAFLKALTQKQLAERAVARARQLLQAGVIGAAELQRREAELEQNTAESSAAGVQLRVLGMPEDAMERLRSDRTVNSSTQILSTIDGRVLERKVTIGQVVQAAETVCLVADLSNVWVVADVPEQNVGAIAVGQTVTAELPAFPSVKLPGKLTYVDAVVKPETRTVRVRMDLPNPGGRFKPAMLATMNLVDQPQRKRVIPLDAIVREGNDENVLIEIAPARFALRKIGLGADTPQGRVLESGLAENENIILQGAFHINNERKRLAMGGE